MDRSLKKWNSNKSTWCLPKKGSAEYNEVRKIMDENKKPKTEVKSKSKAQDKPKAQVKPKEKPKVEEKISNLSSAKIPDGITKRDITVIMNNANTLKEMNKRAGTQGDLNDIQRHRYALNQITKRLYEMKNIEDAYKWQEIINNMVKK